ncbi:MAG: hypothetical protein ACREL6_04260 [Gemmatimonadales bacterium]
MLSSYSSVAESAGPAPADIAALVPALWLSLAAAMLVVGLMVGLSIRRPAGATPPVLILAACFPLATGVLFWRFNGLDSAAVLFLVAGLLTLAASVVRPQEPRS